MARARELPGCVTPALDLLVACTFVLASASAWMFGACGVAKPIVRSFFDQAVELCQWSSVAREQADKAGMNVKDWCAIARNVQPFVDALLSAQARAELALEQKPYDKKSALYICPEPDYDGPADEEKLERRPQDAGAD